MLARKQYDYLARDVAKTMSPEEVKWYLMLCFFPEAKIPFTFEPNVTRVSVPPFIEKEMNSLNCNDHL